MDQQSTLTNTHTVAHAAISSTTIDSISTFVHKRRTSLSSRTTSASDLASEICDRVVQQGSAVVNAAREGGSAVMDRAREGRDVIVQQSSAAMDRAREQGSAVLDRAREGRDVIVQQGSAVMDKAREGRERMAWWARGRLRFFKYEEVPKYLQDNNYILSGYRANYSYVENWISFIHFHNESGNVWTHALAFIWFVGMIFTTFLTEIHPNATFSDRVVLALFLFSGTITFLFSSLFHLHLCHSETAYITFGCLDYSGISALICGSAAAIAYYCFYCDSSARTFWLVLLIFVNMLGVFGPMFKFWATARFRKSRALLYILSGVLSGGPMFQFVVQNGISALPSPDQYFALPGLAGMIALYMAGVVFYVGRFPERIAPGKFDLLGHSHQIWHVCVMAAAWTHSRAVLGFMAWRLEQTTCVAQ